jgi:hypothetical protein
MECYFLSNVIFVIQAFFLFNWVQVFCPESWFLRSACFPYRCFTKKKRKEANWKMCKNQTYIWNKISCTYLSIIRYLKTDIYLSNVPLKSWITKQCWHQQRNREFTVPWILQIQHPPLFYMHKGHQKGTDARVTARQTDEESS